MSHNLQSISSGLNVFTYQGAMTAEEQTAAIATQAAIYRRAEGFVYRRGMNVGDPATYRTDVWWDSVVDAINNLGFPEIVDYPSNQSAHYSFDPPMNVAEKLGQVLGEYIPSFSSAQLRALITLLSGGSTSQSVNACMSSWNGNWKSSSQYAAFGMGPTWKDTQYDRIVSNISFFVISYRGDWSSLFADGHGAHLDVFAGSYQVRFYMFHYNANRWRVQRLLGGSIEDRIHSAPIG